MEPVLFTATENHDKNKKTADPNRTQPFMIMVLPQNERERCTQMPEVCVVYTVRHTHTHVRTGGRYY